MFKFWFWLGLACLVIGFLDLQQAPVGSRAEVEGVILMVLGFALFALSAIVRAFTTRACPDCGERIYNSAVRCKHCHAPLAVRENPK